jgi:hypothetical protein
MLYERTKGVPVSAPGTGEDGCCVAGVHLEKLDDGGEEEVRPGPDRGGMGPCRFPKEFGLK